MKGSMKVYFLKWLHPKEWHWTLVTLTFHWYTKVLVEKWLAIYFLNLKIFRPSVMLWPYLFPFVVVETVVEPQNKVPAPPVLDKGGVTLFTHEPAEDRRLLVTDVVKVTTGCHLQLHHGGICQQQWRVLVKWILSNQTNVVSLGKRLRAIRYVKVYKRSMGQISNLRKN